MLIAAFPWWHAGALRLKLGERAGVPAYLNKWRTPEAPPQEGETTKPRDQEPKQDHRHHTAGGGCRIPWGLGAGEAGGSVWRSQPHPPASQTRAGSYANPTQAINPLT